MPTPVSSAGKSPKFHHINHIRLTPQPPVPLRQQHKTSISPYPNKKSPHILLIQQIILFRVRTIKTYPIIDSKIKINIGTRYLF